MVYPLVTRDDAKPRGVIVLMNEMPAGAATDDGDRVVRAAKSDGKKSERSEKSEKPETKR